MEGGRQGHRTRARTSSAPGQHHVTCYLFRSVRARRMFVGWPQKLPGTHQHVVPRMSLRKEDVAFRGKKEEKQILEQGLNLSRS